MLSNLFRSADLDTQFACFVKQGTQFFFYTSAILDSVYCIYST